MKNDNLENLKGCMIKPIGDSFRGLWGGREEDLRKKKTYKGFTLVELIVVIVILAILAAILIPGLLKWIDKAREKRYELEARNIYLTTEASLAEAYSGRLGTKIANSLASISTTEGFYTLKSANNPGWFNYIREMSGISEITEIRVYLKENKMRALRIDYTSPSDGKRIRATINEIGFECNSSQDTAPSYNSWKADDGLWHFTYLD